jgi:hypothetical protein
VITIYLVVVLYFADAEPLKVEDTQQPSLAARLDRAAQLLDHAATVDAGQGWEFSVTCSLQKQADTPAADRP